jgi:hypothetical protein
MENIIKPDDSFDFTKLSLTHPVGIQGGAFFTKIEYNNKSLYIQTCKSLTKQGFVKAGKKYYCDLMFDKNSETLINWFENLEENCKKLIYGKKDTWFENSLEENDIETAFNSVMKIYKSGKYYLVRTNIKIASNNEPAVKIYNENEIPLTIDDVKENTNIISILEIQGIKFTSRNFQIDIELRQSMVLDNEPLFDNCLIKTNNSNKNLLLEQQKESNSLVKDNKEPLENNSVNETNKSVQNDAINRNVGLGLGLDLELDLGKETTFETNELQENENDENHDDDDDDKDDDDNQITLDVEELCREELEDKTELKELDFTMSLENDLETNENETIKLKNPNEVYYELYKEARQKAKIAKKSAIIAYLEAKNIRQTYMIDNLDESESDIDAEIDEVSESELEGL